MMVKINWLIQVGQQQDSALMENNNQCCVCFSTYELNQFEETGFHWVKLECMWLRLEKIFIKYCLVAQIKGATMATFCMRSLKTVTQY